MPLPKSSDHFSPKSAPVDVLPILGDARQLAVTGSSARTTLSSGVRRLSISAKGCAMRFAVGDGTVTASTTTSHYLQQDERIEFTLPPTEATHIAAVADGGSGTGSLEITELG